MTEFPDMEQAASLALTPRLDKRFFNAETISALSINVLSTIASAGNGIIPADNNDNHPCHLLNEQV
jgi:hypothetical protein